MENERTDVSSSLPTRRSRRVAVDAFVDSARTPAAAAEPQVAPVMTRRALREATPASSAQVSSAVAPVPQPTPQAPMTRRDMRLSRGLDELAQFNSGASASSGSSPVEAAPVVRSRAAHQTAQNFSPQQAVLSEPAVLPEVAVFSTPAELPEAVQPEPMVQPEVVRAPVQEESFPAPVAPRESSGLTRAQLRALEREQSVADPVSEYEPVAVQAPVAEAPVINSPAVAVSDAWVAEVPAPTVAVPVPAASAPVAALPADKDLQSILAEVNAVVAQVERRVEQASREDSPRGPEPLVLRARAQEPVDTQAPLCETHRTGDVPRVDVVPGTSIIIPSPSDSLEETHSFPGEAFGLEVADVVDDPFAREIYGESTHALKPATRVGALSRGTHPVSHVAGHGPRNRWIPRAAVLSTLGLATVGVPMVTAGSDDGGLETFASGEGSISLAALKGPSTLTILNDVGGSDKVPGALALPVSSEERAVLVASRAGERSSLENCDPTVQSSNVNGQIPFSQLCKVMGYYVNPEAAVALTELNNAFNARFGHDMCLVSGYRSLTDQYSVKRTRGSLAAAPGTSNHGLGYAVDLCASTYQAPVKWQWMHENAPKFGWVLPDWASRSYEPWHWEYEKGVKGN